MNLKTLTATTVLGLLVAGPVAAHPHSDNHHEPEIEVCDEFEKRTNDVSINGDFTFQDDDIHIRNKYSGVQMIISEDRELWYNGSRLDLSPRGQELVDAYYDTFDDAMSDFANLASDAAGLGVDAATAVISALFSGDFNEEKIEADVKAKATKIEASAEAACTRLASLESIELAMAVEIDGFEPVLFKKK